VFVVAVCCCVFFFKEKALINKRNRQTERANHDDQATATSGKQDQRRNMQDPCTCKQICTKHST
jgi:hypothetical protein